MPRAVFHESVDGLISPMPLDSDAPAPRAAHAIAHVENPIALDHHVGVLRQVLCVGRAEVALAGREHHGRDVYGDLADDPCGQPFPPSPRAPCKRTHRRERPPPLPRRSLGPAHQPATTRRGPLSISYSPMSSAT